MSSPLPALILAVLLSVTAVVLGVWGRYSERRPRHADAGPGALIVQQLREQAGRDMSEDVALTGEMPAVGRGRWSHWRGTLPLSAAAKRRPGSSNLPGRQPDPIPGLYPNPDQDLLARVLSGLHRL